MAFELGSAVFNTILPIFVSVVCPPSRVISVDISNFDCACVESVNWSDWSLRFVFVFPL